MDGPLAQLDDAGQEQARKLIRRRIKSPKLRAARDALLVGQPSS